jgi:hypothetical protein
MPGPTRVTLTDSTGVPSSGTVLNNAWLQSVYQSIEDWPLDTYTPAWTGSGSNPSIGNAVRSGKYFEIGDLVVFTFSIVMGSTTTYGTGNYSISLPTTASTTWPGNIWTFARDSSAGGAIYPGTAFVATTTTALLLAIASPATNWTPTAPITFANGDSLLGFGVYFRS